jgi:DNA polymerase-1
MVVDMMANGMPVDLDALLELGNWLQGRMDLLQWKIQLNVGHHMPGVTLNPNSAPQMSELIYDRLKLHEKGGMHKAKKGGAKSTADDILKRYLPLHPVVQDIIDWRGYAKLKSSYADAIPKLISPDGRIRTTLRMTRVATGRLSSSKPNLMAQPTRSAEGRRVRDCYVAPEGCVLLSGDYSQVEMRVAASEAKDEKMLEIFWGGEDIHSITASEMFGIPVSRIDEKKHRYPAKRVGFGILNLITAEGLHRELVTGGSTIHSLDDCRQMIKAWFEIYHGIAAYMKANGEYAKRYGYVRDMWGRIRYIPGIKSTNRWSRIEAERQAGNTPIQMGAQGVIKEGMGRLVPIYRELSALGLGELKPLIQIHDDIVWESSEDLLPLAKEEIRRELEGSAPDGFLVPLEVDFKSGKKWGSLSS